MPHIHELVDFVISAFVVCRKKVLLVYHKKYREWLPIGGHIELNEDPEEALYREIREESGLKVKILAKAPAIAHRGVKPLPTPDYIDAHVIGKKHRHVAFVYFGTSTTDCVKLHEREHREYRWLSAKDLSDKRFKLTKSIRFYCREALKKCGALVLACLLAGPALASEIEFVKVHHVDGKAEVLDPANPRWRPLKAPLVLEQGSKIRTGPSGMVDVVFDRDFGHLARIKPLSQVGLLDQKQIRFSLDSGKILFLFEDDLDRGKNPDVSAKVLTRDSRIELWEGGCSVEATKEGTLVRVYSGTADVAGLQKGKIVTPANKIDEAFKFETSARGPVLARMAYKDYADWQVWLRKSYEWKDDYAADRFEKETVIEKY